MSSDTSRTRAPGWTILVVATGGPAAAALPWLLGDRVLARGSAPAALDSLAWLGLGLAAAWGARRTAARVARAHAALLLAAGLGVAAGLLPLVVPGPGEATRAGLLAAAHAAVVLSFAVAELSRRRWRRAARAALDALAAGLVVLGAAAPWVAAAARPGLPAAALAALVATGAGSAAAATLALPDCARGARLRWSVAAAALWLLALVQPARLAVVVGDDAVVRTGVSLTVSGLAALGVVVALGLLVQPPVRTAPRAGVAWWRSEWWALAILAGSLIALAVVTRLASVPPGQLAQEIRAVALGGAGAALLVREGLLRAEIASAWRELRPSGALAEDRLTVLAELARIVAHEIRNSLSVVVSAVDLLRRPQDPRRREEVLESLTEEGERMERLVDELSTFARSGGSAAEDIALLELIREALDRARGHLAWPADTEIDARLPPLGLVTHGDFLRLESSLAALVVAAARHGARRIRVRVQHLESGPAGLGRIAITGDRGDVGADVAADLAAGREPPVLGGSRPDAGILGLAVARRVVQEHGGTVTLARGPSGGLVAEVDLRLVPGAGPGSAAKGAA